MYSNNLICEILKYINNNINSKIYISELENRFFYNRYYIMKLFKKEIGLTIVDYINSIKIYNSINEIKNSNDSIIKIAINNGFYSLEYFSETFKKIVGVNPTIAKKWLRKKGNISISNINIINSSLIKLYEINSIYNKYISNRKNNTPKVKTLSIFK